MNPRNRVVFKPQNFTDNGTYHEVVPSLFPKPLLKHGDPHTADIYSLLGRYGNDIRTWPGEIRASLHPTATVIVTFHSPSGKETLYMPILPLIVASPFI